MQPAPQGLVRTDYRVRRAAFAYSFVALGVLLAERGAGTLAWTLLALQFLVYPHFVYWRARRSPRPRRAELDNLLVDAALLAAWCAALGFPTWPSFGLIGATMLNAVVNRGLKGLAWSLACSAAGAGVGIALLGLDYRPQTGALVMALCVAGVLGYTVAVGFVLYAQTRRLAAARDALRASEERYRLIAENAGDLIAMVDHDARWLYTSPSYARVLDAEDLAPGAPAWRRAHPDDADRACAAVMLSAGDGRPRDVAVRLVDRDGRIRRYKTRVQALGEERPARKLLLVSQDVSDLRESEERLLVAAHAFEDMTEAIVITAADGTIVTVNRAFCELTGFTRDEVLGQPERAIRNALQPPAFYDEVYAVVARQGYWSGTTWARRKNGVVYREWRSVRAVRDAGGATHYVFVFYEVRPNRSSQGTDRNSQPTGRGDG